MERAEFEQRVRHALERANLRWASSPVDEPGAERLQTADDFRVRELMKEFGEITRETAPAAGP